MHNLATATKYLFAFFFFSFFFLAGNKLLAQVTSYTIFQPTDQPVTPLYNDYGTGIELGVKFRTTQNGTVTGIRFYKGAGTTGTHTGSLWTSGGVKLAAAVFTSETDSGWQQVMFAMPVPIDTGVTYVASYFSSSGDYFSTQSYFTQSVANGPLKALANGEDGGNGLFVYSDTSAFPTGSFQSSNYWVDIVFDTEAFFWSVTGNTGTNPGNNFIGTVDSSKLVFKTFNKQRASIWENGVVNIGLNDTSSRPPFRVYPNGDFVSNAINNYNQTGSAYKNGIRYHGRLGYLEVGVSSIIDTTVSNAIEQYETSAIILNTDSRGDIKGQLQNSFIGAYNVHLPSANSIRYSMLTGGSYFLSGNLTHVIGGGVYHTISGDINGSLIMGNSQAITKTDSNSGWFGSNNRNVNGRTNGNITGGWVNNIGASAQLTVGNYLTNKSHAATALGNANVNFTSLPYNSYDSLIVNNTQNIEPNALLLSIGNSNSKTGLTKSNAVSILYNGRTQINTTGFSNNLTESNVTPKAALEIVSTTSGVLLPKLTNAQRNNIASADLYNGLLLYNTDSSSFQFYDGTNWKSLMGGGSTVGGSSQWTNAGDNIYYNTGSAGIGTTTPNANAKLDVNGNIFSSGKIAIGTTDMDKIGSYSLAVNGDALFNKVKVKLYLNWPDYVFHGQYKLPTLKEVEEYIQKNKHLPDVPTAAEVEKDGLDVGANQAILLKKIEELTLYLIEVNKKVEKLSQENEMLKVKLEIKEK
jgi:hypothetical protein